MAVPGRRRPRPNQKPKKKSPAQIQAEKAAKPQTPDSPPVDRLSMPDLQADLGTAWGVGLILSVPELKVLAFQSQGWLDAKIDPKTGKVIRGKKTPGVEWDATQISMQIQNSNWYKQNDANIRIAENARLSDPATWKRKVSEIAGSIRRKATEMGANLEGTNLEELAEKILKSNWSYVDASPGGTIPDSILDQFLVPLIGPDPKGRFGGNAGVNASSIRQTLKQYGVKVTDAWVLDQVRGLEDGTRTEVDVLNSVVELARQTWGPMGSGISDTVPTSQLASPYMATMAAVLELDESVIDLDTPEIKNALMYVDPATGQQRQKSLWEFEQELRRDPRWEGTKQGQKELGDAAMQMMRDFGFWK